MAKRKDSDERTSVPGEGDVPFELNGNPVVLRPTLNACLGLSRLHNSMQQTMDKVWAMDMDTIVTVVGLGLNQPVDRKLQEDVYKTGLFIIRGPVIKFITIVNNGGRPYADEDDTEEKEEDENPPKADQAL